VSPRPFNTWHNTTKEETLKDTPTLSTSHQEKTTLANRRKESDIPKHSHCMMCGTVISASETLCSDECRKQYAEMVKRQKYMRLMPFIPVILIAVFFAALFFMRR
jgi:predicted nucleic acid-binding Zn ribbon protein